MLQRTASAELERGLDFTCHASVLHPRLVKGKLVMLGSLRPLVDEDGLTTSLYFQGHRRFEWTMPAVKPTC
jgi:hypothetical protein